MDHPQYYRSLEDMSHFTGFGTEIGMADLDPVLLHHQQHHQDRIDLNLHLAPPPLDSTYGFLPLGSGFGVDMLNPSPAAGFPNHSTRWPRLTTSSSSMASSTTTTGGMFSSIFFDNSSSGPPSPGEIDFTAFHRQPPFWGFDFPEADPGHHEHLDLDLSPLLHEHFLQQEEQIGSSRGDAAIPPPASSRRTPSAAAVLDALPKTYNAGGATKKNSGSASASADASSPQQQANNNNKEEEDLKSSKWKDFFFDCNVCLDVASEPVVTSCGHLFCWPCLYQWLHVHSHNAECPVCKGAVSDSDIVPIYGRGGGATSAAENIPSTAAGGDIPGNVPPRPRARRTDSVRQRQAARWRGGDHMLHEMLRWRRAVQFMQENVDRIFNHGGGNNHHRRPRRRMPERRERQHFARSAAEDALLAAMHERMGMPSMEMEHTAASIQARIASVEGMIDQLWQTPPPPFIDLTTPDSPVFTPMLPRDPAAAYPILHGLRRMPV